MSGNMVKFSSNGSACDGYLSKSVSGKGPGLVVIQEWWGLVDHIKAVADRFAGEGFTALAPDLYHGKSTSSPDEAGKLFMALNIGQAEKDLQGAIHYLLSLAETAGKKVGTVGFCMGGQLSLYAACVNHSVGACVDYYGIHPNVRPSFESLQAPVLGFFGETDSFVAPEAVRKLESQFQKMGKAVEFHIFPGVGHAFFNDTRKDVYNAAVAKQSWQRTIEFLKDNL